MLEDGRCRSGGDGQILKATSSICSASSSGPCWSWLSSITGVATSEESLISLLIRGLLLSEFRRCRQRWRLHSVSCCLHAVRSSLEYRDACYSLTWLGCGRCGRFRSLAANALSTLAPLLLCTLTKSRLPGRRPVRLRHRLHDRSWEAWHFSWHFPVGLHLAQALLVLLLAESLFGLVESSQCGCLATVTLLKRRRQMYLLLNITDRRTSRGRCS